MAAPEPGHVAEREERRIALGVSEIADETASWLGGALCFAGPGSWANQALGVAMGGQTATSEAIEAMASWFESRGAEPKVVVNPYADPSLLPALGEAGFRLREVETVLARDPLDALAGAPTPEGVTLGILDRDDDGEVEAAAGLSASVFGAEGPPDPSTLESMRRAMRHPRVTTVLARLGGEPVGAASLEILDGLGALFGGAVAPAARRRGVHGAMVVRRLELAAELGCDAVTIASRPGERTERAALRFGFGVAYNTFTLVRPGPGLAPSP